MLDSRTCYRALATRDIRFDGRFFVGVTTTGIYCRPVCPAGPPRAENCRFFVSAAAASEAGFRPCLRCRPESAPGSGAWRGTSTVVSRALSLIAEGAFDGESGSMEMFADRLGVGARQLRRLFQQHVGASPIAVVQTQRLHLAKQLLHDTDLPMTDVASASGFRSLRRFNETFRVLFKRPPSKIRQARARRAASSESTIVVRLPYRCPYDWDAMLRYLRARAIGGIEEVSDDVYARTVSLDGAAGVVRVRHVRAKRSLEVEIRFPGVRGLAPTIARVRRMFDLDADVDAIGRHLRRDALLVGLLDARPGLRVPGAWSGWELGVRAILGQQVAVEQGRKLVERLVERCGTDSPSPDGTLSRIFPSPEAVAIAPLEDFGVPRRRRDALGSLARATLADPELFRAGATTERTVQRLSAVAGIGGWTAHYIAMRAAHDPDAFPSTDVVLLRNFGRLAAPVDAKELTARAERWRPWRAYAAQHLWAAAPPHEETP